ncbi:MAG: hypothetical protein SFT94_08125 [Pseudanabaenaceae cyanobacterium bins.68]|nr:hypothetical protein [Pseudanabaenaceae cyanobacterium bins.68]
MQYLAELKKIQSMLGTNVELRLLARNVSDNSWQPVGGDEHLKLDPNLAKELKDGQLVIADISASKNVHNVQEASKRLVLLLQNFSRLEQKYKQGEEDIEQWKQSLNYQTQELHRREVELEERQQQLIDLEARREQLEGVEERLRQQQAELVAQQERIDHQLATLNVEEVQYLYSLSSRALQADGHGLIQLVNQGQEQLNGFWHQIEAQKQRAAHEQEQVDQITQAWQTQKQQWLAAYGDRLTAELNQTHQSYVQQLLVAEAQEVNARLAQLQAIIEMVNELLKGLGNVVEVLSPEEVERLEQMDLRELGENLQQWENDFEQLSAFVIAQEEELAVLEGEIANLKSEIARADAFTRLELEQDKEFKEEQYHYSLPTLEGQRKNMRDRLAILDHQRSIYERRSGIVNVDNLSLSLRPVSGLLEALRASLQQQADNLQQQIASLEVEPIDHKSAEFELQQQRLATSEQQLQEKSHVASYLWGALTEQEQVLRPAQELLDRLRQQLENGAGSEVIVELHQRIAAMLQAPQSGDLVMGS